MGFLTPECAVAGCTRRGVHRVATMVDVTSWNDDGEPVFLEGAGEREVPICVEHYHAVADGALRGLSLGVEA
jgi:hypothetical protein